MEYKQLTSIDDPLFAQMHQLMQKIFPKEEVLEFELWREPLQDPQIRMFVAVENGEVVGATEYRYYPGTRIAMTDFTIIGHEGRGIGAFLAKKRSEDLFALAKQHNEEIIGMFAEIYDPYKVKDESFGELTAMNPVVRREVLSHLGYQRLDIPYVHPSWLNDGEAVHGLDLCFLPYQEGLTSLKGAFIADFLKTYYSVLSNKPQEWHDLIAELEKREVVELRAI